MYVNPRPKYEDDPNFALRAGLAAAAGMLAVAIIQPVLQSVFIQFSFMAVVMNRKALNVTNLLIAVVALVSLVWVVGFLLAITRGVPLFMFTLIWVIFLGGFYVARQYNSTLGSMINVMTAGLSVAAMKKVYLLNFFWNDFMGAMIVAGLITICVYFLVPPKSKEYFHKPKDLPPTPHAFKGALIRATVTLGVVFWLYTVLTYLDMYLIIATIYPLAYPTYRESFGEGSDRFFGTIYGSISSYVLMACAYINSSLLFLMMSVGAMTTFWAWKMMTGSRPSMVYQYAVIVMSSIFMHGLYSGEQIYFSVERTWFTFLGAMGGSLIIAILDRIFLPTYRLSTPSLHPHIQKLDYGRELN